MTPQLCAPIVIATDAKQNLFNINAGEERIADIGGEARGRGSGGSSGGMKKIRPRGTKGGESIKNKKNLFSGTLFPPERLPW
jgi:hypothetical protein